MAEIIRVLPETIESIWPHVEGRVEQICTGTVEGLTGADDVLRLCLSGDMQLWVVIDSGEPLAVATTEIIAYPKAKVCQVGVAGEQRGRWIVDFKRELENWSRHMGCTRARIVGRKGWARVLPDYRLSAYVLEREL